ncbi:CHAT domain-containing protein, partial [Candidatus Bipolaricaulota bacterium]|nr:CHAT domain-containing protein [Candidatus Bipolaricaulota bacterium]
LYAERYDESIAALEKALEVTHDPNYQEPQLGLYLQFADVYTNAGRLIEAIDYLARALAIAQETEAVGRQMQIHGCLAEVCQRIGRTEEAKTHYEETIRIIERTFYGLEEEALQEAFFPHVRQVYVEFFRFLLGLGELDDTLWLAERCRARTYAGRVADIGGSYLDLLPEAGIRSGVFQAEAIENDAKQVVLELPTNVAAIEYFVMPERTLVWAATGGTVHGPYIIPISSADLRNRVIEFRGAIERTDTDLVGLPDEMLLGMAAELHVLLIGPISSYLSDVDHLVIVPSGSLYYLPFAALLECPGCRGVELLGGAYLAERYTLSYGPSLATLHHAWSLPRTEETNYGLLAFADPATGDPSLLRLPEAQEEARAIAALFDQSEIHVAELASEDVLRQSVAGARFLLISTHGVFDPANPMYSYLLFSPTSTSDGRLHTYEVFELPLQADLVTLSACETLLPALEETKEEVRAARGLSSDTPVELTVEQLDDLVTGDDIVGLTRAFIYAGSSSVLSTLWRVVSEPTEALMVTFYGYLQQGFDKAQALRQAQLDVMASYPHPRYWAAFELVGDWR